MSTRGYYGSTCLSSSATPVVLRQRLPGTVTRHERYTKSLSSSTLPLSQLSHHYLDKADNKSFISSIFTSSRNNRVTSPTSTTLPTEKRTFSVRKPLSYFRTSTSTLLPNWWKKAPNFCTPTELLDIIKEPVGYYALPTDPYNEVYPGIYLSDAPTALCTALLKKLGITHVLNAAQGKERHCGQVNTSPGFYSYTGIKFLGVEAFDNVVFRLYLYFEEAAQFIDEALNSGGKVLVHCRAGISRSATLVCAFLMLRRNMSVQEAVKRVRQNRAIIPNDGFLQQLCDLNDRLLEKQR